jgi:hypothetical protein
MSYLSRCPIVCVLEEPIAEVRPMPGNRSLPQQPLGRVPERSDERFPLLILAVPLSFFSALVPGNRDL